MGSTDELEEMVLIAGNLFQKVWQSTSVSSGHSYRPLSSMVTGFRGNLTWGPGAVPGLYHFMRCSQLEYVGQDGRTPIQVTIMP